MGKFILAAGPTGQILMTEKEDSTGKEYECDHFHISSLLLQRAKKYGPEKAVKNLSRIATGNETQEEPIQIDSWSAFLTHQNPFAIEVEALQYAINTWIAEQKPPALWNTSFFAMFFEKPELLPEGLAAEAFLYRCRQLQTRPEINSELFNGQLTTLYESDTLLPLAWAEVWYALQNKLRFRVCPYCGKVFKLPNNAPFKSYCGDADCRQKYLIDYHGGLEAYREWERVRKKKLGGGKRGRPRKRKDNGNGD